MMHSNETLPGYRGPYVERGGESARILTDILLDEPEVLLNDTEKQAAYDFEAELFDHEIVDGASITDILKDHKPEALTAPLFFADALIEDRAKDFVIELDAELPIFQTHQEVFVWLAERANDQAVDASVLAKLSKYSIDYYTRHMSQALLQDEEIDPRTEEAQSIVLNPTREIGLSHNAQKVRAFLLNLRTIYKEGGEPLDGAKRAIIDVYLAKVNTEIAGDISMMGYVREQAELIGDHELAAAARAAIPGGFKSAFDAEELPARLMDRLDYLKNGMGIGRNGEATPLSAKLYEKNQRAETASVGESLFSEAEKRIFQTIMIPADKIVEIYTNVLHKAGVLSSEDPSTWTPTRRGRAADELFQVIRHPNKNTFTLDGVTATYQTPSGERSLYDVLIVGGAHELAHINQIRAGDELGKTLKIAKLKGKRVSMLREGGANLKEREAELKLFGMTEPSGALTYANAIEVLRSGGTLMDAARAFRDEKLAYFPDANPTQVATEAADRVLRLKRFSGYNSQPLSYAEEVMMQQELDGASPEIQDRAAAVTSFDLVDQVRLHRYGLLPNVEDNSIDWTSLVLEELGPYIEYALESSSKT